MLVDTIESDNIMNKWQLLNLIFPCDNDGERIIAKYIYYRIWNIYVIRAGY